MKQEIEICVKCNESLEEVVKKLKTKGFVVKEDFYLDDIYFVKKDIDLKDENIFSSYILLRNRVGKEISFMIKEKTDIVKSLICPIVNFDKGYEFLINIGYKKLLRLKDHNLLFSNGKDEVYIQAVENLGVYLEIEANVYNDTYDKLIDKINSYNFDIDKSNYHRKKAYDMLNKE